MPEQPNPMEELQEVFQDLAEKAETHGMECEERETLYRLGLSICAAELYRIEDDHGGEEGAIVNPHVLYLLRQIGLLVDTTKDAEVSKLIDPRTGKPMRKVKDGEEEGPNS